MSESEKEQVPEPETQGDESRGSTGTEEAKPEEPTQDEEAQKE